MDQSDLVEPMQETGATQENNVSESDKKIAELVKANTILKANISTLYRTARAEVTRKNNMIAELQSELDSLIFKRMDRKNDQAKKISHSNPTNSTTTKSSA